MKIVGGSFGASGNMFVGEDGLLHIEGAVNRQLQPSDVSGVEATTTKETKFATTGFVLGAPIAILIGWYFFALFGAVVGLLLAIAGSFYRKKTISATVVLKTGERVIVDGWNSDIQNLTRFAANK